MPKKVTDAQVLRHPLVKRIRMYLNDGWEIDGQVEGVSLDRESDKTDKTIDWTYEHEGWSVGLKRKIEEPEED